MVRSRPRIFGPCLRPWSVNNRGKGSKTKNQVRFGADLNGSRRTLETFWMKEMISGRLAKFMVMKMLLIEVSMLACLS